MTSLTEIHHQQRRTTGQGRPHLQDRDQVVQPFLARVVCWFQILPKCVLPMKFTTQLVELYLY
jgi:hypothetical protein